MSTATKNQERLAGIIAEIVTTLGLDVGDCNLGPGPDICALGDEAVAALKARLGSTPSGRAEELITQLEAEIVKRDARIAELEAPMLAWSELDYTKHTRRSLMCYIGQQNFRITAQEKQLAALKARPSAVHLLFDGPPGPECGRFVEAEDAAGRSINAGEWSRRPDGYWQLVIQRPCTGDLLAKIAELEQSVEVATTECVQQYRWRLENSECGRDEINDGVDMLLARLKAQPSGVVDSDEVMQMAFEIGEPADDGSGYWFDMESFDEFIAAYTARLNPCRAQYVSDGLFFKDSQELAEALGAVKCLHDMSVELIAERVFAQRGEC